MAYNLIGKDFTPMDVEAKVTGRAKYAEDFRADNMAFCKTLTSPIPHAKIKSIDTSEALKIPGVLGILTADDVPQFPPPALPILAKDEVYYVGDPILAVAAESEQAATDAIEAIKIDFQQLPHVVDPLESLFPGGPNARTAGNVAAGQIKLQTVKWDAADFAAAGDTKMPMGHAAEEWSYGDVDGGFKNAKVTIEESFVTGTYSHNCMETRTTFAYWQGGKCFLHGSNQSHTAAIANIARYIGIPPENLVFIAEYCGGGFGSKIPGYPNMAIAALLSKKINRPLMHRITRTEEYGIGAARPGFQGYIKMGFARRRQAAGRRHVPGAGKRTACHRGRLPRRRQRADHDVPAGCLQIPQRSGSDQHRPDGRPSRSGREPVRGAGRTHVRQGGQAAEYRPHRHPPHQCAGQQRQDRQGTRPAHQRLPEGSAGQGRGSCSNGTTARNCRARKPATRSSASASARAITRPAPTALTACCASPRTASCTSIPASATSAPIPIRPRRASPRICSTATGKMW